MEEKIGEVNFGKFKTWFFVMPETKMYLEEKGISLACLLPEGYDWYETRLSEIISSDESGKEYGNEFIVLYNGIVENKDDGESSEMDFEEEIENEHAVVKSTLDVKGEEFLVRFVLLAK